MLKRFFLSSLLVLLTVNAWAIKILHPDVKINNIKLSSKMYLLNETEMASFTAWKIRNDFYKKELVRKETEIKLYKDFNKALMEKFTTVSSAYMKASDNVIKQINGRIRDRKNARNRVRKANFFGILKGIIYGVVYSKAKAFW